MKRIQQLPVDPPHTSVDVMVTACTEMPLSDAAKFLDRETEWPAKVMLAGMREHYPDIAVTDIVVVIEHLTPGQTKVLATSPTSARGTRRN